MVKPFLPTPVSMSWLQQLMELIPDYAASKGISPPQEKAPAALPPADANNTTNAARIPDPMPNVVNPNKNEASISVERNQEPPRQIPQYDPIMQPPPSENNNDALAFSSDKIQPSAEDIAAASANPIYAGATSLNIGKALSGIKTPAAPQFQQQSAPGIPQANSIKSNLHDILNAAGLTPAAPVVGLSLAKRL